MDPGIIKPRVVMPSPTNVEHLPQRTSKKQKSLKSRLRLCLVGFFQKTSVHGFARILDSPFVLTKIIWTGLLITGCAAAIYIIRQTIADYLNYYTVTETKTILTHDKLIFPAVTVCHIASPTVQLYWSEIKFELVETNNMRNYTMHDMRCHVFNSGRDSHGNAVNLTSSKLGGAVFGFEMKLAFGNLANDEVYLYIGDNMIRPTINEYRNILVKPGYNLQFSLKKVITEKLPIPYNDCLSGLGGPDAFDSVSYRDTIAAGITYRQLNCIEICEVKIISDTCNCSWTGFNEKDGYSNCYEDPISTQCVIYQNLNFNLTHCYAECPLECNSVAFTRQMQSFQTPGSDLIKLSLFYDEMSYVRNSELAKINELELVSSFGGTFGLFLGLSLLSFVEFAVFFVEFGFISIAGLVQKIGQAC